MRVSFPFVTRDHPRRKKKSAMRMWRTASTHESPEQREKKERRKGGGAPRLPTTTQCITVTTHAGMEIVTDPGNAQRQFNTLTILDGMLGGKKERMGGDEKEFQRAVRRHRPAPFARG